MADVGQEAAPLIARARPLSWGALAVVLAATPALFFWSFTVDDALIPIRYARHLALGMGYRFNAEGPSTDGVTPLLWPFILLPLAHGAPLVVLTRAKELGLVVWLAAVAGWGVAVGRADVPYGPKAIAFAALAVCVPLATHAVSGMETALATALATWAAVLHGRPRVAALLAGMCATFRPEMLPWALTLGLGFAWSGAKRAPAHALACGLFAGLPFVGCACARLVLFGHVAPLAVLAKPGDLAQGFAYTVIAALVSTGPLLACAPLAAARVKGTPLVLIAAGGVHLLAVAFAGGDWMPFARLVAPIVPSLLLASVLVSPGSHGPAAAFRALLGLGFGLRALVFAVPWARSVEPDRERLIARVAPLVEGASHVASVDVGWLSAATDASIVDLGGATDSEIAALPGSHTSKRVDDALLLAKGTDAILLYANGGNVSLDSWRDAAFPHVVDARLADSDLVAAHFRAEAFIPLGAKGNGYYVLRARR